jgi:hypothetical protein
MKKAHFTSTGMGIHSELLDALRVGIGTTMNREHLGMGASEPAYV